MNYPKISIVTPSFNQGQFLEETMDSILSQNYPNLEYIVIDGGSSDNSIEIIKKYEKYLSFWISEKDKGHGDALNKGFSRTSGEIMAWLNSDDKYFPWALETAANAFLENKDVHWLTGLSSTIDAKSRLTGSYRKMLSKQDYLVGDYKWIQQESTFWTRDLWNRAGAEISLNRKLMVDGDLWGRFFLYETLWHIDVAMGAYRNHGVNRASAFVDDVIYEMEDITRVLRNTVDRKEVLSAFNVKFWRKIRNLFRRISVNIDFMETGRSYSLKNVENKWTKVVEKK